MTKDSKTATLIDRAKWVANTLFHQTLAVLAMFILWTIIYNYEMSEYFTLHMVLCTIAYIPLMAEGVILFVGENVWSQYIERKTKYWIHGVLLLASAIVVTIGNACIIHAEGHGRHFRSKHGWTALVSWVLILLSQFLGLVACKPQISARFFKPVWLKFLHNVLGLTGYMFGVTSLYYGLNYGSFTFYVSSEAQSLTIYALWLVVVWSCLGALISAYNQLKDIVAINLMLLYKMFILFLV